MRIALPRRTLPSKKRKAMVSQPGFPRSYSSIIGGPPVGCAEAAVAVEVALVVALVMVAMPAMVVAVVEGRVI